MSDSTPDKGMNPKGRKRHPGAKQGDASRKQPAPGVNGSGKSAPPEPPFGPTASAGRFTGKRGNSLTKFKNLKAVEAMSAQKLPARMMAQHLGVSTRQVHNYVRELRREVADAIGDPSEFLRNVMVRIQGDASKLRSKELFGLSIKAEVAIAQVFKQLGDTKRENDRMKADADYRLSLGAGAPGADRQIAFEKLPALGLGEEVIDQEFNVLVLLEAHPGDAESFGQEFASDARKIAARWMLLADRHDVGGPAEVPRLPLLLPHVVEEHPGPELHNGPLPRRDEPDDPEPVAKPKDPQQVHSVPLPAGAVAADVEPEGECTAYDIIGGVVTERR